jgi:hypothetical protein
MGALPDQRGLSKTTGNPTVDERIIEHLIEHLKEGTHETL